MIRIIGDRLSWEIKAALLHTIGLLIAKAGPGLKPFVPQLQTTFLKCLGDQVCSMSSVIALTTCCSMAVFKPNSMHSSLQTTVAYGVAHHERFNESAVTFVDACNVRYPISMQWHGVSALPLVPDISWVLTSVYAAGTPSTAKCS